MLTLLPILLQLALFPASFAWQPQSVHSRREWIKLTSGLAGGVVGVKLPSNAAAAENQATFDSYKVIPDASERLSPEIQPIQQKKFLKAVSNMKGGSVWLGEHHNSVKDHKLQLEILRSIHESRSSAGGKTAIGLEQVQLKFQPVLDDYLAGRISLSEMRQGVQWDTRWMWPFEVYQPIFEMAKDLTMPLVALNVDSEDLVLVEKGGFPNLPRDRTRAYISDPSGFAEFARPRSYSTYVNYVIRPSYKLHEDMGLLRYTMGGEKLDEPMTFSNFFSARILWDESMANTAHSWTKANPGGLLVGLVGADHVKFRDGIPGRYARLAGDGVDCISVMLNPTLIDTRPSGSVGMEGSSSNNPNTITLQLRYLKDDVDSSSEARSLPTATGGVLALSDFIAISYEH